MIGAWSTGNPLDRLLNDLEAAEHAANPAVLARRWEARAEEDDFWSRHHDFGRPLPTPQPWLVGAGRAGEVELPGIVPVRGAANAAGRDWLGLKTTNESVLKSVNRVPLFAGFFGLALLLLALGGMWYREGR